MSSLFATTQPCEPGTGKGLAVPSSDALALDVTNSVGKKKSSSFAHHLCLFSLANLGALVCNGVLTFFLPRWLAMEDYGYYRLFLLYGSFVGVLHLGLLDGVLVRWAERPRIRMRAELRHSLAFMLLQHAALLFPATAILLIWFRHRPWFFLAAAVVVYAVIWNAAILGQFALQADKSFGWLSAVTVVQPAVLLSAVGLLAYGQQLNLGSLLAIYLGAWLAAGIAVWIVLLKRHPDEKYQTRFRIPTRIWRTGTHNIGLGWSVLLSSLVTNLALSLDRLVVSVAFSIRDFAIYSLAATALAVVNTIILSVSRVVFPYLSDGPAAKLRIQAYGWAEALLMGIWAMSLCGYFPLRYFIERLLPAYRPSLPILRLLMLSTGLTALIYILHTNYFRSSRRLGALLLGASVGLSAAAVLLVAARFTHRLANMSWAMLAAIALWWSVDECLLRAELSRTPRQIGRTLVFTLACGAFFLLSSAISVPWRGALVYCATALMLTAAVYWKPMYSAFCWSRAASLLRTPVLD